MVAPLDNRSGVSRALTLGRTIAVKDVELADGSPALAVDGTPVDCVRFAALGLLDRPPDIVLSGINIGVNAGDDLGYSGTVGAAFEALLQGWGAIAASQFFGGGWKPELGEYIDFDALARFVVELIPLLGTDAVPEDTLLNVNGPRAELRGAKVASLGSRWYHDRLELERQDADGRHYWIYGTQPSFAPKAGTDLMALDEGYITVTPVKYHRTDMGSVAALKDAGLPGVHIPEER